MKDSYLKIISIIAFLAILIPNQKFIFPNLMYLILGVFSLFDKSTFSLTTIIYLIIAIISFVLVFKKSIRSNYIGYILSICYFLPHFNHNVNNRIYTYFIVSFIIYMIVIFFTLKSLTKDRGIN